MRYVKSSFVKFSREYLNHSLPSPFILLKKSYHLNFCQLITISLNTTLVTLHSFFCKMFQWSLHDVMELLLGASEFRKDVPKLTRGQSDLHLNFQVCEAPPYKQCYVGAFRLPRASFRAITKQRGGSPQSPSKMKITFGPLAKQSGNIHQACTAPLPKQYYRLLIKLTKAPFPFCSGSCYEQIWQHEVLFICPGCISSL